MKKESKSNFLPKTLIFDFDGTLCDSLQSAVEALNFYADEFGYRKVQSEDLSHFQNKSAREIMSHLGISLIQLPHVAYKAKKRIRTHIDTLSPIAGIPEALSHLKTQDYQLGILTSNSEENVRGFLEQHQLEVFDFIYADSSLFGKATVMKKLLKEKKLSAHEVIYVGDEIRDIEAAKSLAIKIVSVSWGYNSKEILQAESPDYLIDHPSELVSLYRQ
jgi:phosphoglycolate phosphatase